MDNNENLINIFQKILNENQEEKLLNDMTKGNMIHAFIKTMSIFIEQSQERTFQGLYLAMKKASELIAKKVKEDPKISNGRSTLTLKAVSEIMLNLINKHISTKLNEEFSVIKKKLVSISNDFYLMSLFAKEKISKSFLQTLKNKLNILVHGYSLTVLHSLIYAHNKGLNFKVYITECRPDNSGELFASKLNDNGITNVLILDNSVGYVMENIDCVVVGADAVVENGGIINKIGTFTMAICAKCFKKPVYVLCESLKFLRMFNDKKYNEQILADYTSPEFITLLFTDLGIFTPSAVSDELIQMFNN